MKCARGFPGLRGDDSEKVPRIIEKGLRVQNPYVEMPVVDVDVGPFGKEHLGENAAVRDRDLDRVILPRDRRRP